LTICTDVHTIKCIINGIRSESFLRAKRRRRKANNTGEDMKKEYDFSKGKRGAVDPTPLGKTRITIRLDNEIIDWFRRQVEDRGGGNYQTMINNALRDYISNDYKNIEETVRNVIREEISRLEKYENPRADWEKSFKKMRRRGDDALLDKEAERESDWDREEWRW